jgi:MFS family permease
MTFFTNRDINKLALHTGLHQAAAGLSQVFYVAFLLHAGLAPASVFLAFAAILTGRFFLRLMVPALVQRLGFRNTLILGSLLFVVEFLILAAYDGSIARLFWFIAADSVCSTIYWTCYHAFYSALGDPEERGAQVGARGLVSTAAAVAAPAIGGFLLVAAGPWTSFGVAAILAVISAWPLLSVREPYVPPAPPTESFWAVRDSILLFTSDGFITCISWISWDIVSFLSYGESFEVFGGVLALASLAGALCGMAFGRLIDRGHGTRAVIVNAVMLTAVVLLKAAAVGSAPAVAIATIVANVVAGLYLPVLMTAIYNDAKATACALRFHIIAEAGWDVGGTFGCVIAATALTAGATPALVLLFAIVGIVPQAWLARRRYQEHAQRISAVGQAAE